MMRTYSSHRVLGAFRRRRVLRHSFAIAFLVSCIAVNVSAQLIQDDYGYSISPHQTSDLFFLDSTHGWMTVDDHTRNQSFLLKTTDGGNTWSERKAPEGIIRLNFLSVGIGYALVELSTEGGSGNRTYYLERTSDGGDSWTKSGPILESAQGAATDLAFINQKHGWVVGQGTYGRSAVWETVDAGKSFHELPELSKSIKVLRGVTAGEKEGIWIYGVGTAMHSSDEGKTWRQSVDLQELGTNPDAFDISSACFWNTGRGWLAGQDPDAIILGTEDFGQHWRVALRTQEAGNFRGISFWDEEHGCSASFYPALLFCTNDGGSTWKSKNVLPPAGDKQAAFFLKLIMLKSGRGWALRAGGFLYETVDGGQNWHSLDIISEMKPAND